MDGAAKVGGPGHRVAVQRVAVERVAVEPAAVERVAVRRLAVRRLAVERAAVHREGAAVRRRLAAVVRRPPGRCRGAEEVPPIETAAHRSIAAAQPEQVRGWRPAVRPAVGVGRAGELVRGMSPRSAPTEGRASVASK